jgi:hypothetical protein
MALTRTGARSGTGRPSHQQSSGSVNDSGLIVTAGRRADGAL